MNGRRPPSGLRTFRIADAEPHGPHWRGAEFPEAMQRTPAELARIEFAALVVRRLVDPEARVGVVDLDGRPAMLNCRERLFETQSKDHPIVGIYTAGARVRDVVDDLKAAGL